MKKFLADIGDILEAWIIGECIFTEKAEMIYGGNQERGKSSLPVWMPPIAEP